MKVLQVLVELLATWVWWTAMVVSPAGECLSMVEGNDTIELLRFTEISFNTQGGSYTTFIQDLRNKVKGPTTVENIPVTKDPSTITDLQKRYLLVKLQAPDPDAEEESVRTVTLVVAVTDLYVLGYGDKYQGKDRARYFKGYDKIIKDVFSAAGTLYEEIPFGFSYDKLAAAGAPRDGSKLGIYYLKGAILSVSGKDLKKKQKVEAKFLVTAIQMVSEAARFKYIEGRIGQKGQEGEVPDKCAIGLEGTWDKISKAIQKVEKLNTEGKLDACPHLSGLRGDELTKAIIKYKEDYIGILKFSKAKLDYPG